MNKNMLKWLCAPKSIQLVPYHVYLSEVLYMPLRDVEINVSQKIFVVKNKQGYYLDISIQSTTMRLSNKEEKIFFSTSLKDLLIFAKKYLITKQLRDESYIIEQIMEKRFP